LLLDPADFSNYSALLDRIRQFEPLIVFNGLHGKDGEDGKIQALLELEKIPYTGSDSRASALAMDKEISGLVALAVGLKLPARIVVQTEAEIQTELILRKIGLPLVVKPNDSGSSVGISIVDEVTQILPAFREAIKHSRKVILEKFVAGRELTVTILDGKALPVVEIKPRNGWYDYTNKYTKGNTVYEAPAQLLLQEVHTIQKMAETIFSHLGCSVYSRVDFRYDGENFFFLEVNTLPGMTPLSLTPMAAKSAGIGFEELLTRIIQASLRNFS